MGKRAWLNQPIAIGLMAFTSFTALSSAGGAWAHAVPIEVGQAPSTSLELSLKAIGSAKESLLINVYELTIPEIATAIQERIRAGIHVEILQEGQPVGGITAAGRGIQSQILASMSQMHNGDRYFEMASSGRKTRRYRYDHAKYVVVDGKHLLISSENYSPNGHPEAGSTGNRGWEVFVHDESLAQAFTRIFRADANPASGDIAVLSREPSNCSFMNVYCPQVFADGGQMLGFSVPQGFATRDWSPEQEAQSIPLMEASQVLPITSPDTSLNGLTQMLRGAQHQIDLQQMSLSVTWKDAADDSPLVEEFFAASRRGVVVRVLLNDDTAFFPPGSTKESQNLKIATLLNARAAREGVPVYARVANLAAMGVTIIHNKGALIDSDRTLISSINWNENSVTRNRETAVLVTSPAVHAHYQALFDSDWSVSSRRAVAGQPSTGGGRSGGSTSSTWPPRPPVRKLGASVSLMNESEEPGLELCPERVRVITEIGALELPDGVDPSFKSIANATSDVLFVRHLQQGSECVLQEEASSSGTPGEGNPVVSMRRHRYLQIHKRGQESLSISLEGFTPKGKLYSVRSIKRIGDPAILDGSYNASVYDGSGPSPKKLGRAKMTLETYPNK